VSTIPARTNRNAPVTLWYGLRLAVGIFVSLLAIETTLLAVCVGHAPNAISLPLFEQLPLLATLWGSNPAAALSVTAQQAVFVVQHRPTATGLPTWGIYYYPLTLAVHLLIAFMASSYFTRPINRRWQIHAFVYGAALLGVSVSYVRLASCCTVGPRWVLDVLLLSQALDPMSTLLAWQHLYTQIEPLLPWIQVVMVTSGAMLLYASRREHVVSLPPAARRHAD
jgi:hypothetical protein